MEQEKRLKIRKNRMFYGVPLILVIIILSAYFNFRGYSLTAQGAAHNNAYYEATATLLGDVEMNSFKVFFYESSDKYNTIITKKDLFILQSNNSYWVSKTDDKVKLVGWCSMTDTDTSKSITAIPVQSFDTQVAYIEMGQGDDKITKNTPYGVTVIFAWGKTVSWNKLNAIAYSSDSKPIYKLGYNDINGTIKTSELRWLPVM